MPLGRMHDASRNFAARCVAPKYNRDWRTAHKLYGAGQTGHGSSTGKLRRHAHDSLTICGNQREWHAQIYPDLRPPLPLLPSDRSSD